MSKLILPPIIERGLIAAGMISVVIITMAAHLSNKPQAIVELDNWRLRSSFDPLSLQEGQSADEYQDGAAHGHWEE
jgi:hypothetical protein